MEKAEIIRAVKERIRESPLGFKRFKELKGSCVGHTVPCNLCPLELHSVSCNMIIDKFYPNENQSTRQMRDALRWKFMLEYILCKRNQPEFEF